MTTENGNTATSGFDVVALARDAGCTTIDLDGNPVDARLRLTAFANLAFAAAGPDIARAGGLPEAQYDSSHHRQRLPIAAVLTDLASQENCDGEPYAAMQFAARYIRALEAQRGSPATADERAAANERACPFCETVHDGNSCMGAYRERASQATAPATKTLSDLQDEIAAVMQQHMEGDAGVVAINTCALAVARHVMQQAAAPADAREPNQVYVECRQCDRCDHIGINDGHDTDAACGHSCGWSGPSPAEDKCPGCGATNCMSVACPKCSALYTLLADGRFQADEISAPADAGEAVLTAAARQTDSAPPAHHTELPDGEGSEA